MTTVLVTGWLSPPPCTYKLSSHRLTCRALAPAVPRTNQFSLIRKAARIILGYRSLRFDPKHLRIELCRLALVTEPNSPANLSRYKAAHIRPDTLFGNRGLLTQLCTVCQSS